VTALLSFAEAIQDSARCAKRHLILGNGFSIACRADIFHYASLFAQADFSIVPEVAHVFDALGTQDFEVAIHALENTARIMPAYVPHDAGASTKMLEHAAALKEILVSTIAANHPNNPAEIPDEQFWACRQFLANFLGVGGNQVFSLNYDLLLYWTLMHDDAPDGYGVELEKNDGFGNSEDEPDADYVVWQGEIGAHNARVHFLHGALHLYDSGTELIKYTWVRKGVPLVKQAREAIDADAYPLFVAEGTSEKKKNKIRHNAYLYQGFKQLTANVQTGTHCFFVFGHSFGESDGHILNRLGRGRFRHLYVGVFGDPASPDNQGLIQRAQALAGQRPAAWPLEIAFYDAASAEVWGHGA
jgi:hypothetical protein